MLTLTGTDAADALTGTDAPDRIAGLAGNDTLIGGRGDDALRGNEGDDRFRVRRHDGADAIGGGRGEDVAVFGGNAGADTLDVGFDRVFRDFSGARLLGVETLRLDTRAGADDVTISAGAATDRIVLRLGDDTDADVLSLLGTAAADLLVLGDLANGFAALCLGPDIAVRDFDAAHDRLILSLGEGNDTINAAGLSAADLIVAAGAGNDAGFLGAGNDLWSYVGEGGNDDVQGGAGTDTFELDGSVEGRGYVITGGGTAATLGIANTPTAIRLGGFERIDIEAFGGDDFVFALSLQDIRLRLDGGAGNDTLTAGQADDVLAGGAGDDTLTGGFGADRFLFGAEDNDGVQDHDVIADYSQAEGDVLDIRIAPGLFLANATEDGMLITLLSGNDFDSILVLGVTSLPELTVVF